MQAIDNSVTTETPASTTPVKPDEGKKPADKEKPQSKPSVSVVHVTDTQTAQDKITKAHEKLVTAKTELERISNFSYNKDTFDSFVKYAKAQHKTLTGKQADKDAFVALQGKTPYKAGNSDAKTSFANFIDGLPQNPAAYKAVIDYGNVLDNWNEISTVVTTMPGLTPTAAPAHA
ncbi:hypothetical protein [Levilactobacillus angrenensis]|uniref:Uncharacterized protein n=1 Tax=Levilactobacillus angrenensis TaxID=2486020 RepID=A0ABW1U5Z7_9LACO|nr:hypothetical protein [Levilactobacillus angrenensis]